MKELKFYDIWLGVCFFLVFVKALNNEYIKIKKQLKSMLAEENKNKKSRKVFFLNI